MPRFRLDSRAPFQATTVVIGEAVVRVGAFKGFTDRGKESVIQALSHVVDGEARQDEGYRYTVGNCRRSWIGFQAAQNARRTSLEGGGVQRCSGSETRKQPGVAGDVVDFGLQQGEVAAAARMGWRPGSARHAAPEVVEEGHVGYFGHDLVVQQRVVIGEALPPR